MTITERAAYLKGLMEGLELDQENKQVKVLNVIVEMLNDMALTISDLETDCSELSDQLDAVDEDLYSLEEDFYENEDEDEDYDEENGEAFYEVTCPTCQKTVCLPEDALLSGEIECPECGESLEFNIDGCNCCCVDEDFDCCCCEEE